MSARRFLLGFDLGSSFVKASLLDADTGRRVAAGSAPSSEMPIDAPQPGWAEQDPDAWWTYAVEAGRQALSVAGAPPDSVAAIGIAYQMHGLVVVDDEQRPLRPAIIWCDSRAVAAGEYAFLSIGSLTCFARLLNAPGNFTAAKLRWVQEHEPEVYARIHQVMLPGDYLAMRLTGQCATTASGLSEGIFWDYLDAGVSRDVLECFGFDERLLPRRVPTFGIQGELGEAAAAALGLRPGVPVAYRAGDQPNNAFSLNVLEPGECAATAGTSGVVYAVGDQAIWDSDSRVNTFLHVNHTADAPRYGTLLCVNGTGAVNSWLKRLVADPAGISYEEMNRQAATVAPGADGLFLLPYGNGAERTLHNRDLGASLHGLSVVRHGSAHLFRAAQEGIVFALGYGVELLRGMGLEPRTVRAGHANMFLSPLFAQAFADVTLARVELFDTDGAQGAARGAGVGAGLYASPADAFAGLTRVRVVEPDPTGREVYANLYRQWRQILEREIGNSAAGV